MIRRWVLASAAFVLLAGPAAAEETPSPTDPAATEPAPGVPEVDSEEFFTFVDDRIVESSGLAVVNDLFVTINDSGGGTRIFVVNPETGNTIGVVRWEKAAYDFEALAPAGHNEVWVGDVGDNNNGRETIWLHRVPVRSGRQKVEAESYELDYPDGRHNAEGLLRHPQTGQVFVVSKDPVVGRIYAVPEDPSTDEVNRMRGVGAVLGLATGGAFFPNGKHVMIRGYSNAIIYTWPDLEEVAEVKLPHQPQGEALAIDDDGEIFLSTELVHRPVLRITLPEDLQEVVFDIDPDPEPEPVLETDAAEEQPMWPYLFMGGMALVVLYGAFRAGRAFFSDE